MNITVSHVPNIFNYQISGYFDLLYQPNIQHLVTQLAISQGRAQQNQQLNLSAVERKEYIEQLRLIKHKYGIMVTYFERVKEQFNHVYIIQPDGNLLANSFSTHKLGNILETSLTTLINQDQLPSVNRRKHERETDRNHQL